MGNTPRSIFDFWREDIKLYPNGISRKRCPAVRNARQSSPSIRGSITRFSSHSALRLRRALLNNTLANGYVNLGITLTLPWKLSNDSDPAKVHTDYKIAFNRFCVAFRRRFGLSAAIFRHELQVRRAPHAHIVLWLSDLDHNYTSTTSGEFRAIIFGMWSRAVSGFDYNYSRLDYFARRGVLVDRLSDNIAMYRYISDHASKRKATQLGYLGKQWGYINRSVFVPTSSINLKFNRSQDYICFNRHISKCARFYVGKNRKLSSRTMNRSVVFVKSRTVLNLYAAINSGRVCSVSDLQYYLYRQHFDRLKKFKSSSLIVRNL